MSGFEWLGAYGAFLLVLFGFAVLMYRRDRSLYKWAEFEDRSRHAGGIGSKGRVHFLCLHLAEANDKVSSGRLFRS